MLRKISLGVSILVMLLVVAAFVVPMLIPKDWLREQIKAEAKKATGRDLIIGSDLSLQLLPSVMVNMNDVRFANVEGGSRPNMVNLKELRMHLALLPLLSSEVEVREFVLVEPDILLEVDKNGRANWAFSGSEPDAELGTAAGSGASGGDASQSVGLDSLRLGDVRLLDGRLEYRDYRSGTAETVEDLNVVLLPARYE